jgi:hypothetical protein
MKSRSGEMSVSEWFRRSICALLAFAVVLFGAAGLMFVALTDILPHIATHRYAFALCSGLTCLASSFGLPPMALWINRYLLQSLGGLAPLPSSEKAATVDK